MAPRRTDSGTSVRVGIIDTGVNPWHSHVGGEVAGCRIYLDGGGRVREDGDIRDLAGHGTAVAGVLRQELPHAALYAIRVFAGNLRTYPSLVARGILHAAGEGCTVINLSLGVPDGPGSKVLAEACRTVLAHGCTLVAALDPGGLTTLPAALPGVIGAVADDTLPPGVVLPVDGKPGRYRATSQPRILEGLTPYVQPVGFFFRLRQSHGPDRRQSLDERTSTQWRHGLSLHAHRLRHTRFSSESYSPSTNRSPRIPPHTLRPRVGGNTPLPDNTIYFFLTRKRPAPTLRPQ